MRKGNNQNVFEQEYQLGYAERVLLLQRIWKIRRKRSAAGLQEVLETRSRAICLEVFRKPIIRTEDYLLDYQITLQSLFEELDGEGSFLDVTVKRIDILANTVECRSNLRN